MENLTYRMQNLTFKRFTQDFMDTVRDIRRDQTKEEKRAGYQLRMARKEERERRGRRAEYSDPG